MAKGLLIVVSGPSGCGKGTLLAEVLKGEQIYYSVSATTRAPREGEEDGVHYHFMTREGFLDLVHQGGMLEYAEFCGNFYGTPRKAVEDKLEEGVDVILEIEVQGAMKIKRSYPEAVFVFILPPSIEELRRRLEKRGSETGEVIQRRVQEAAREIETAVNYDYLVVNRTLEDAVDDLKAVIRGEKHRSKRTVAVIDEVLRYDA